MYEGFTFPVRFWKRTPEHYNIAMNPLVLEALNKMSATATTSVLMGPIDDLKFYWQIISPQPWWIILIIALRFALPVVWPLITGKYRVRF